jgi:uncharacterized protein with GYD domain
MLCLACIKTPIKTFGGLVIKYLFAQCSHDFAVWIVGVQNDGSAFALLIGITVAMPMRMHALRQLCEKSSLRMVSPNPQNIA